MSHPSCRRPSSVLLGLCCGRYHPSRHRSSPATATEAELTAIIDDHWQWTLTQYPERRLEYGDRSGNDQWTNMSLEAFQKRYEDEGRFVQRLEQIEPATLSADAQVNRAMLLRQLRDNLTEYEDGLHLIALDMRSGPQHRHSMIDTLPMVSAQDHEDWLNRLRGLPEQLSQYRALLSEGINRDRTQAQIVMSRVPSQIANLITDQASDSPFYRAFAAMPEEIDPEIQIWLKSAATAIIEEQINPALRELLEFLESDYLPAARPPGIGALPGGKQVYSRLAQHFTTTELTPDEIHEIGLREVARIRGEMETVIDTVGFDGDIVAFNDFLRTDPQFYYETPEALLEGYQAVSKRLDPGLVNLFGKLPRAPYGVRPIPDEEAPDTTTAYYMRPAIDGSRPGWYYVNLYQPEVRPKFEMEVLSVHESVPGHHSADLRWRRNSRAYRSFDATADSPPSSRDGACTPSDSATTWAFMRIPIRGMGSLFTTCGARFGSWSTRASTTLAGAGKKPSTTSLPTPPKAKPTSSTRSTVTSAGRAKPWPTRSVR